MIVLAISVRETHEGIIYQCEPSKASTRDYTPAEISVAKEIMFGVQLVLRRAAKRWKMPVTQINWDKGTKK